MKKFKLIQATVATAMAVSMFGLTACEIFGDNSQTGDGKTYEVTLNVDNGDLMASLSEYVSGETTPLPNAEKAHYTFDGWYTNAQFTGSPVYNISKSSKGDVEYWAKWTPETYSIKYYLNGAEYTQSSVTSYTYNEIATLPAPTRDNYSLDGWYESSNYNGESVATIVKGEYGDKVYYAKWNADMYGVTLVLNEGELKNNLSGYTYGIGATLPIPTRDGYRFDGWFTQDNGGGTKVESITATDKGNKTYYAKWTLTAAIDVKASGGYEEGAYVEINPTSKVKLSNVQVSYKLLDDIKSYKKIDSALIREVTKGDKTYIRADIVGLSEGSYSIKVSADGSEVTKEVTVTSYDRSGYAFHDRNSYAKTTSAKIGIGAYKDDGSPKDNAQIIYVTEATKNSVTATFGSKTYTGIGNILTNLNKAENPVIIRVVGTIGAATWKKIDYNTEGKYNPSNKIPESNIKGTNGKKLPTSSTDLTQDALISGGYNELDDSVYSKLDGLSSKATYSSGAYDSCWNDCSISAGAHDVTVEGIGNDAELVQWGMTWKQASSIEVRNLTFTDYTEDACSFQGNTNIKDGTIASFESYYLWLHNCTFNRGKNYWDVSDEQDKHDGDGSSDLKLVYGVTLSYNHYIDTHKTGLVGAGDTSHSYNVTFHHNYYEGCESRMPLARLANMHMYNNYYKDSSGTNMSLRTSAWAFVENCYFDNAKNPVTVADTTAVIKIYGCEFVKGSYGNQSALTTKDNQIVKVTSKNTKITNDGNKNPYANFDTGSNFYTYTATTAAQAKTDCIANSGVLKK